ncbi:hypothetical protein EDB85DRAFT_2151491 [Lactarius pseudohatsudake]|nr:hypothetical protein EDB85DRAFT_2151491 [Lactarius pseudohatsudake]
MSLLIKLGDLYSSRHHRRTREVAKAHVWAHFVREQLKNRRVRIATVRPTGWHPENNAGGSGWHLTVDFRTRNKVHVTTHHIYYDAGTVGLGESTKDGASRVIGRQASSFP